MIGCDCDVCTSTDPRDTRLRTSAFVRFTDAAGSSRGILIDPGPDLRQQALRHALTRCDAILCTHSHVDHIFGLDEVRRFNAVMRTPIDIHADERTMQSLRRVYPHIFEREKNVNDSFVAALTPWTIPQADIDAGRPLDLFGMDATPIPLLHGRLPIMGYRLEPSPELLASWSAAQRAASPFPLAYCTDLSAFPPGAWGRLKGLKTLVLDALRHRAHPTHLTLAEAVRLAAEIAAERTYFVHMAHELPHEATQATLPAGMSLAYDGLALA
jgi:phosphoribosyl 1,2-cyclic phosphate phosphodiesterase